MHQKIMVIGSGRLAHRLTRVLKDRHISVIAVASGEFKEIDATEVQESSMDYARELLTSRGIKDVSSVCIVDTEDSINIYLLMAVLAIREGVRIYASFFNESFVAQLAVENPNIKIFNPASIVSKLFVDVIPRGDHCKNKIKASKTYRDYPSDGLILWLVVGFMFLMVSGAWFFRITESVDWLRSIYLVITVITSVNFNDAEIKNYNLTVQVLRMGLMLATYAYVIIVLAFIVDQVVKRRTDVLMFGRRRYSNRNHVIVCGLGRVGYAIVQALIAKKEDIIVIEADPDNRYMPAIRAAKIPVLIGDSRLPHYLIDAGVARAKALVCAIDNDLTNLEIGLSARFENPNIRLLLRIFDQATADEMKKRMNIHYVFSKSFATANAIYSRIELDLASQNPQRAKKAQEVQNGILYH